MKVCPNCKSMLKREKAAWVCKRDGCDGSMEAASTIRVTETQVEFKAKVAIENQKDNRTSMESRCPKCSHERAYYEVMQTRSSDEPPTTFLECVKCQNRWREY